MLTKSQARLFFVGGTTFFSLIFIALTIDTINQLDERQNTHLLTGAVARGKMHALGEGTALVRASL